MTDLVDVFIPCHRKDGKVLKRCIKSINRYLVPKPNRIVVISDGLPPSLQSRITRWGATVIDASSIPDCVRRPDMPRIISEGLDRTGWYLQQFIKWAVRKCSSSENYVVVDADTVFLRPVVLMRNNKLIFHRSAQFHVPYFKTYEKLLGYFPERRRSFIVSYMIFKVIIYLTRG